MGIAIPVILVGIMELIKLFGLPKRFIPYANAILSIALSVIYLYPNNFKQGFFVGILIALTSMGLYNSSKSVIKHVQEE
jgi:hypothetical protein